MLKLDNYLKTTGLSVETLKAAINQIKDREQRAHDAQIAAPQEFISFLDGDEIKNLNRTHAVEIIEARIKARSDAELLAQWFELKGYID